VPAVQGNKIKVHTLLDALNEMAVVPERKTAAPLRLPISGAYKIKGVGDVLAGRVEQGEVKPGDEVIFLPTHTAANPCIGKVRSGQGSLVAELIDAAVTLRLGVSMLA
jgi:elongation factor 1-alpha